MLDPLLVVLCRCELDHTIGSKCNARLAWTTQCQQHQMLLSEATSCQNLTPWWQLLSVYHWDLFHSIYNRCNNNVTEIYSWKWYFNIQWLLDFVEVIPIMPSVLTKSSIARGTEKYIYRWSHRCSLQWHNIGCQVICWHSDDEFQVAYVNTRPELFQVTYW